MKSLLVLSFFFFSYLVRISRWTSIIQQKEYRLDRLVLFLKSPDGLQELRRLLPSKTDFTKVGFKRPKITGRSVAVVIFFIFLTFLFGAVYVSLSTKILLMNYLSPLWMVPLLVLFGLLIYLICIPQLLLVSVIPTALIATVTTYMVLLKASLKLKKNKPKIIGITGSYGKTTTKLLLAHVLESKYTVFKTPRSFNTKYSVAESILKGYDAQEIAILEYAAYKKGEIKSLASWFQPSLAIVTGLAEQHVGLFGSLDNIISAKAELVQSLPSGSTVICNAFNEQTKRIVEVGSKGKQLKKIYLTPEDSHVVLLKVGLSKGARLHFVWQGEFVQTQLIGLHYSEVVKMVIKAALILHLTNDEIIPALENFVPDDRFIYTYTHASDATVLSDGNSSNPKGFSAIIKLARSFVQKRKILITAGIVDLSESTAPIHTALAVEANKVFDVVVFVGENGRDDFKESYKGLFITEQSQLTSLMQTFSADDLLVIEGKVPPWVTEVLK